MSWKKSSNHIDWVLDMKEFAFLFNMYNNWYANLTPINPEANKVS